VKVLPLQTPFKPRGSDGWTFTIEARTGDVALVSKTHPDVPRRAWEVHVIQRHDGYEINGKPIEAGESLASTTSFGKCAWAPADEAAARKRFDEVVASEADRAAKEAAKAAKEVA
jgi:mitochondrial fission protein ELM1